MSIIKNLSMKSYNDIVALRSSDLKSFMASPAHYKYHKSLSMEDNPNLSIGSAVHTLILEPEKFKDEFLIYRAHKTRCQGFYAVARSNPDKITLLQTEYDQIQRVVESARSKPHIMDLISKGEPELSIMGQVEGVACKCRCDSWVDADGLIIDIKTTGRPAYQFKDAVIDFGYHYSNAFYELVMEANGMKVKDFIFVVLEKAPPYEAALIKINRANVEAVKEDVRVKLRQFKECMVNDVWPGYSPEVKEITL